MQWPLLADLASAHRAELLAAARPRRYGRGVVVFHEGDAADSLHLVAAGRLAVRVTTPAGDTATLNILRPGDYFGELSLLRTKGPTQRTATVLALEPAETLALPASVFHQLCEREPKVEQMLVTLLAQRVEELSSRLLEALYVGLDRRLYRRLHDLVGVYADDRHGPVTIPLTQEHLAELVGGTRPTVNQVLQRLADQGIVELGRGRTIVQDRTALARKAGR